ncbi:MAG: hypothetical protein D6706_15005 [Chloroflexi bacterium]|nr:MAG: hypothetical protein D6706_15005 [Chloroflexota bacterium]
MTRIWRIWLVLVLLVSLWTMPSRATAVSADSSAATITAQAQTILERMSVEERVGQLFLVTFQGDTAERNSDIAELILTYRVGGVLLLAENNNITGYGDVDNVPVQVAELVNDLQRLAMLGLTTAVSEPTDPTIDPDAVPPTPIPPITPSGVPLFIAISQEGSNLPFSQIHNGLTPLPNNMAIGATWQPDMARVTGEILGQELSAIGINMLLGPSLDVLENPNPFNPNQIGVRSFGGHPYWVGQMGQAFIAGLHQGSQNRLAVIAKHFPGNGSSDRPVQQEIPTVRKNLAQLRQTELAPFFTVTGLAETAETTTDGLLVTHIRYQGFQGSIQATTPPVSLDPQALSILMQLPEIAPWRQNGGLLVSDALGVRAVERFYDDTQQEFPHRRVAKDALLAGNDLLLLADFALGDADYAIQLSNIKDTILWFREKYETDPSFQQRVDEAVLRILSLKLKLYGENFSLNDVLVDPNKVAGQLAGGETAVFSLAQAALTLISPSPTELAERIPSPPGPQDNIVIFTDVRTHQQCTTCPEQPIISKTALENRILALYGPQASNQIAATQIHSFSLTDLQAFLNAGPGLIQLPTPVITATTNEAGTPFPTPTTAPPPPGYEVQQALREATWIIFALMDNSETAAAFHAFLAERPDIVRSARVIVFAFDAPYFLDATEISKLTAYYGVYSTTEAFIDAAVRALFQESSLPGASPVDIEGINYRIAEQTRPDPAQIIELFVVRDGEPQSPAGTEPLAVSIGETLHLQTGIIKDRNGHPVPDGTLVQFIQRDRIQGIVSIIAEVPTHNGTAQLDYVLEARTGPGQFRITAVSGDAKISQEVDIAIEGEAQISIITPTPVPTPTPTPVPTATLAPTDTAVPLSTATSIPTPAPETNEPVIQIAISRFWLLFAMLGGLTTTGFIPLLIRQFRQQPLSQRLGQLLWGITGGLLAYNYIMLHLPGSDILGPISPWQSLLITLLGGLIGLIAYTYRHQNHQ